MITPVSHQVSRVWCYSGTPPTCYLSFEYATITLYGRPFQARSSTRSQVLCGSHNPARSAEIPGYKLQIPNNFQYSIEFWKLVIFWLLLLGYWMFCASHSLDFSLFARHYLGNLIRFLFLRLLRCFSSPAYLLTPTLRRGALHKGGVSPFGDPRIKACLAAPRGLSQLTTSFIGLLLPRRPPYALKRNIIFPEVEFLHLATLGTPVKSV